MYLKRDPNVGCPLQFLKQEIQDYEKNKDNWATVHALINYWSKELGGLIEDGWISNELYETAVERNKSLRLEFAGGGPEDDLKKLEQGWPFQNH
jgi:hypothetical protein